MYKIDKINDLEQKPMKKKEVKGEDKQFSDIGMQKEEEKFEVPIELVHRWEVLCGLLNLPPN